MRPQSSARLFAIIAFLVIVCGLLFGILYYYLSAICCSEPYTFSATAQSVYATNTAVEKFIEGTQTVRAATAQERR